MITVTDSARKKISELLTEESDPLVKLRAFVVGGGCSGMNYGFELAHDVDSDDYTIAIDSFLLLVDAISMQYLTGSTIDYSGALMSKQFVIKNPLAKHTCGCGSSFAV